MIDDGQTHMHTHINGRSTRSDPIRAQRPLLEHIRSHSSENRRQVQTSSDLTCAQDPLLKPSARIVADVSSETRITDVHAVAHMVLVV